MVKILGEKIFEGNLHFLSPHPQTTWEVTEFGGGALPPLPPPLSMPLHVYIYLGTLLTCPSQRDSPRPYTKRKKMFNIFEI